MANCIKLSSYTTAVATITTPTMPNGMKLRFSKNIFGNLRCTDDNLPSICMLSKRLISNILGIVSYMKLKLTMLAVLMLN